MKINLQYLLFISTIITFTDQTNDKKSGSRSSTCVPRNARLKEKQDDWRNQVLSTFHKYDKTKVYEPNPVEIIEIMKRIYDEETTLASTKLRRLRSLNDSMIEGIPFIGDFMPFDIDDLGEDFKFRVDDVTDGRNYSLALEIKELQRYMRMVFERFQNNPYRHLALDPAFVEFRFVVGDKLDSLTEIINYLIFGKGEIDKDSLLHLRSLCEGTEGITNIARYMHNRITQDCQDGKDHLIRVESSKALLNAKDLRVFRDNGSDRKMKSNDTKTRHKRGIDDDSPTTCLSDAILKVSKFEYKSLDRLVGMIGGDLGRLRLIAPICTWAIGGQNRDLSRYLNRQIVQLYLSSLDYLINDFSVRKGMSQAVEDYQVRKMLVSVGLDKQAETDMTGKSGERIFDEQIKNLQKDTQQMIDKMGKHEMQKHVLMMANDVLTEDEDVLKLRIMRTTTHNLGSLDSIVDASYFRSVILRRPRGKELEEAEAEIRRIYSLNTKILETYLGSIRRVLPEDLNEGIAKKFIDTFGPNISVIVNSYHKAIEVTGQYLTHPKGNWYTGPLRLDYDFHSTPCHFSEAALMFLYKKFTSLLTAIAKTINFEGISPGPIVEFIVEFVKVNAMSSVKGFVQLIFPYEENFIQFGPVETFLEEIEKAVSDFPKWAGDIMHEVLSMILGEVNFLIDLFITPIANVIQVIIDWIGDLFNVAVNAIKNFFKRFLPIGYREKALRRLHRLHQVEKMGIADVARKVAEAFVAAIKAGLKEALKFTNMTSTAQIAFQDMMRHYFGTCSWTTVTVWISPKIE